MWVDTEFACVFLSKYHVLTIFSVFLLCVHDHLGICVCDMGIRDSVQKNDLASCVPYVMVHLYTLLAELTSTMEC